MIIWRRIGHLEEVMIRQYEANARANFQTCGVGTSRRMERVFGEIKHFFADYKYVVLESYAAIAKRNNSTLRK